jgi:hypothetical protein
MRFQNLFANKSPSRQGKGVASICENLNSYVEGVVFELTSADWDSLDRCEGVPDSYIRKLVVISINGGKEIEAETYIANPMEGYPFKPAKLYMDLIIRGAEENGLSKDYIERLKKIECEEE